MDKSYRIEPMTPHEVSICIEWAKKQGWNPGCYDAQCFYQADPHGFFAGKLGDTIIAMGAAVAYDEHFAFVGLYIVDDAYRGQGYGFELTKTLLTYIGSRNAGLDGVLAMAKKYANIGFHSAYKHGRFSGRFVPQDDHARIVPLNDVPFDDLLNYDRRYFPANRTHFLRCWINQPESVALAYRSTTGALQGYGVLRRCYEGYKIGPLFAEDKTIATHLLLALAGHAKGDIVYIDVPDNNPDAMALVQDHSLQKTFEVERMYLKGEPPNVRSRGIFGITTYELG